MGVGLAGRRWCLLATVAVVWFLVLLDDTAVTIAVAPISRSLRLGTTGPAWVVNAYTVTFAMATLTGGAVADRWGARPVFLAGVGVFTAASLVAGLAAGGAMLIVARAVQGAGAALIGPAAMVVLLARFEGPSRGPALGVWSGVAAAALAGGPLLGAVLSGGALGWRTIFLINVPLGIGALILASWVLPRKERPPRYGRFDTVGAITSAVGILALVYALTQASTTGWSSPRLWAILAVAAASLAGFAVTQRRAAAPLLDPALLRAANFAPANLLGLLNLAIMCGLFFYIGLYLQTAAGASTLQAGVALLPLTVLAAVLAPAAGAAVSRLGARWLITAGMGILAAGLLLLARIDPAWGAGQLRTGLLLAGVGIGVAATPVTTAALSHVPASQQGMASATINTTRSLGLAVGIAVMGAVVAAAGPIDVTTPAGRQAAAAGISAGLVLDAILAVTAALLAATLIRSKPSARPGEGERALVPRLADSDLPVGATAGTTATPTRGGRASANHRVTAEDTDLA